jgi:hypothetical protein
MARQRRFHARKGPACSVCTHRDRVRIEASRIAGVSLDNLAKKFGCGRDAIHRHMHNHVSEDQRSQYILAVPVQDLAKAAAEEGLSVVEYLGIIRTTLLQEFQLAAAAHDKNATAILAGRLVELLRVLGSITGEVLRSPAVANITTTNTVNFVNSPIFADLQQMLIKRLAGHPEELSSVIEGLRELEDRSAPRPVAPLTIEHSHREPAHA